MIQPIYDEQANFFSFTKITRDCTVQRATDLPLRETPRNLDLALASMMQGLCLFDAHGRLALRNARFAEILGFDGALLKPGFGMREILRNVMRRTRPAARSELRSLRMHLAGGHQDEGQTRSGELGYLERILSVSTRSLEHGGAFLRLEDVTTRRKSEQQIEYLARHDTLTGLPNRFDFQARLKRLLASSGAKSRFALLCLDLARFKVVNDMLGHHSGDELLKLVAKRLSGTLRDSGQLYRLGGDEFTILLPRCLVEAKRKGRNCHRVYESGMDNPLRLRNALENELGSDRRHRRQNHSGFYQNPVQPVGEELFRNRRSVQPCNAKVARCHIL